MARILVVEDEEMERQLDEAILESAGHEVYFAEDGEAAFDVLRHSTIHLVVTDLAMPGFNGLRFIKALRENGYDVPIIAVSGRAADQLDLAVDYGANRTIMKPLDGNELLRVVKELLGVQDANEWQDPWRQSRYR